MIRIWGFALALGLVFLLSFASGRGSTPNDILPRTNLFIGSHGIETEIAAQSRHREKGLMDRDAMPMDHGMLFVFPRAKSHCMWMRNTRIPLSVAFLDEAGTIINIEQMAPHSEDQHCAQRPARYALEMNQGWFAQRGIVAGQPVRGLP